ncbi:MAG TPA: Jag N-terminal domain-containing protein [Candidatus Bathyarchaeia archaeon]|nr:Jag N-terminal domain-containing protein [Candidatus Bathyarchaeia archaeon]
MKKKEPQKMVFEAGTVEEAIEKAMAHFGCAREEINVKVVCEEKRGLFGMEGAVPAKIAVTLR